MTANLPTIAREKESSWTGSEAAAVMKTLTLQVIFRSVTDA